MDVIAALPLKLLPASVAWVLVSSAEGAGQNRPLRIENPADATDRATDWQVAAASLSRVYTVAGGAITSECRFDSALIAAGMRTAAYRRSGSSCKHWRDGLSAAVTASSTTQSGVGRISIGTNTPQGEGGALRYSALYVYKSATEANLLRLVSAVERRWPNYG